MSSKLSRKASMSIGRSVPGLVTKRLEKLGFRVENQSGTDMVEFEMKGGESMDGAAAVVDITSMLVSEACGSDKGVMKRPEGDIVLNTKAPVDRKTFDQVTRSVDIKFNDLPADVGVAAIAEMTYNRCLRKDFPNEVIIAEKFPTCLCPSGNRFDYVIAGLVVISYSGSPGKAVLRANIKSIEVLMGRMCSQDFVETVLPPKWKEIGKMDPDQLTDALEEASQCISDHWGAAEEKNDRLKANVAFLMNAVGADLRACFHQQTETGGGILRCPRKTIEAARNSIDDWMTTCEKLTTIDWRADWKGPAFVDPSLQRSRERLEAISALRALYDEIVELLGSDALRALRGDTLWAAFEGVELFDASPATETKWVAAMSSFSRRLEPIEHQCAAELRSFFSERISLSPQAILSEVSQFKRLLKRPIVAKELAAERDTLLAKLTERMQTIRIEFSRRQSSIDNEDQQREDRKLQAGRYMPGVVNKIVWIRQLRGRITQMLEMAATMLNDLARHDAFKQTANELLEGLQEYETDTFKNWTLDIGDQARELTLDSRSPVISFNAADKIEVNYSERLVQLLREERLFTAMGFAVPSDITKMCRQAMIFYHSGVALKQLATVYNTMGEEIIRSTLSMLEGSAGKFGDLIGSDKNRVTWNDKGQTDRFIKSLRDAAASLTGDNRLLHVVHTDITNIVIELFKIDLLRSRDRWMNRVRSIREKIVRSEFRNTESWTTHWDMQIFKALEHQYQLGLESLHETLPEIRADVIFDPKTGRVGLRPPLEQIKDTYYGKLRDFVTFPARFHGISGTDVFRKMINMNERGILAVMQHSWALFRRVEKVLKKFQPLVAIGQCGLRGSFTLEEIVGAALTEAQHWEQNIRLLKQKGKEIGAVEMFIKVDCITLSTAGIKSAVEEQLGRLAEVLNVTLRRSSQAHLTKIDAFLDTALAELDKRFTKLEDLTKAAGLQAQLHEQRTKYSIEFSLFENKNKLLQSMSGTRGIPFKTTKTRWDTFVQRLESYEEEMASQLEAMKHSVDSALTTFRGNLETFAAQWNERKPKDPNDQGALKFVTEKQEAFKPLQERAADLKAQCHYFQMDNPDFSVIDELAEDLKAYEGMWKVMEDFKGQIQVLRDENWITFRTKIFKFEDTVKGWQDQLRTSEFATTPIGVHLRMLLDEWNRLVPVLKFVRGDGMTPNHWAEMFRIIGIDRSTTSDSLLFGALLDRHSAIVSNEKSLKALHARAQGEAQIREALDDVRAWAQSAEFKLVPHQDRKGVVLITEWKEVITTVNDNQALLFSLKDSPYFGPFAEDAQQWESRLSRADAYLQFMNQIQRKWVYLEPIFARGALPQEQQRFERTDKEYLAIMAGVAKDPKVVSLTNHADYKDKLKAILEQLERCQKALNEFLEQKRDKFPRFYFISDDDLLEILGQSRNVQVIQSHLKKLFMGIHAVRFDKAQKHIEHISSLEGETVTLLKPVEIKVEVEDWLRDLDVEMKKTLKQHLLQCVDKMDITAYASQILCACEQVHFTKKTEEAIVANTDANQTSLRTHRASLNAQLKELTSFSAGNTDEVLGLKVRALIMDLIHSIEVVDMLIRENVKSLDDWLWRKQLRFYINRDGECVIRMVDAEFKYTYEYQGNAPKLVHTPLTDKCYLTLTQGMQLGYGGNPYGPAGTGKTESVKALGNAMGRQVLVFNCDEGIDFKSMGRIFTGLVKCGAWGCFDEFNRLKVDQLSAVSQMIQVIQEALKQGEDRCQLLGREIDVNPNAGIFVTLNPAGKGYGGRSKLPDNLKQLFRAVAMSAPDNQLITETILFSEGFENATDLATKVIAVFRMSKQLLSAQQHYDWGLRALKAVLRLGGVLVHHYLKDKLTNGITHTPEEIMRTESEIIIKSLRVNTLSKLTFDDVKLFNALINDVFPGVAIREIQYEELRPAILDAIKELKLQVLEGQIQKILQLYEALNQRMGVVLVGPSGSGKSTLLRILRKAMQKLGTTVPLWAMNPKAMPREQLLGRMDLDTREWYDGVLTEAAKKVVREPTTTRSWIFCDGDIDPEWVESLNSVLDDNKLLTLPNGVRIQFGSNVNFVFETHSLEFASPATVSRMGMIFLSEEDVDPKSAVASWLAEQPADVAGKLGPWLEEHFYKALETLIATKALVVSTTKMGLVMSGLSQLHDCQNKAHFAIGLIRGLGSYLGDAARVEFAKDIFHMTGVRAPDPKNPLDCTFDPHRGGLSPLAYEASFDLSVDELKNYPMIKTVEVHRHLATLEAWVRGPNYRPFVLVGPEGCGKTMLLRNCFASVPNVRVATVNCSAQTTANHVIQKLLQSCQTFSTNQGRVLRPKEADRLILVLKDLNLPKPDKYNTVMLHSFLQQLVLYQGFYDAHDLEWVSVERLQVVASMNPPGSMGRYPVASRFIAIVSVMCMSYPTKSSLETIYSDFFTAMLASPQLQSMPQGVSAKSAADFARAVTNVYDGVMKRFTVDDASHYIFNPRDVTKWILGVLSYNADGSDLMQLLYYEGMRVFGDRLVSSDHRRKFEKILADSFASLGWQKGDADTRYYTTWLDTNKIRRLGLTKMEDLKKCADQAKMLYARESRELDVQLIPEVLSWMSRVDRVLATEGGNALIVGRTGTGGTEMVRLCGAQLKLPFFSLNITRTYSVKNFNADVKAAMQVAGVEGQHCVLFVEDYHLIDSGFLERINSLLAAGEVPGLYTQEEVDAMLGPMKEEAMAEGFTEGVYSYFVNRVSRFLHVMLVMDPTNVEYELRCRSNPALFTRCSVLWLGSWSVESLKLVPKVILKDVFRSLESREGSDKEWGLHRELVKIHESAGSRFSPQHFKSLLQNYRNIYTVKSNATGESLSKLKLGLDKLAEAEQNVDQIQKTVTEQKALMETKQKEADEALVQIQAKMEEAGEQKKQIKAIQKDVDVEQKNISERAKVIEEKLAGIQPMLDAAKEAVGQIENRHLTELKSLRTPPAAVQDVLEGVLTLLGQTDQSWAGMRKWLAADGVRQILSFDPASLSPATRDATRKILTAKANSFKPDVIERASKAAAPMAPWVSANIDYSEVCEKIQPMRDELKGYESNLNKLNDKVKHYEEKVKKVDVKIEELKKNFGNKTKEAERLKDKLEQAEATLTAAQDLLSKLAGEKSRWSKQVSVIQAEERIMPKKALLAAAFVTYLGCEPEDARRRIINEWSASQQITDFNYFTFMRTEATSLLYKSQGLPSDGLSMENAVSILDQSRTPLIVDPANQAAEWLKNHMKSKEIPIEVCSPADERFANTLELAIRFGKTLLITEMDKIEPILYPVIRRELLTDGPKKVLQIGDKLVDFAESFQLFLLTRATNMRIPPDVAAHLTEVSFTITRGGLEGQLLGVTIQKEQPELEQQKIALLKEEESLKLQLEALEDSLLRDLAQSKGSLLENKTLIDSLNQLKTQAQSIENALNKSKELSIALDEKREVYRPLAARGSAAFFLMRDLKALSHMYQFSLSMFLALFRRSLDEVDNNHTTVQDKIQALAKRLVVLVVRSVSRALFKDDRVTFGVHMARALSENCCTNEEWNFFVDKSTASDKSSDTVPAWLLADSVAPFKQLRASCPHLLPKYQLNETDLWYEWLGSSTPESNYPPFLAKLSPFERLIAIKVFRGDRLIAAMNMWACEVLGVNTLSEATTLATLLPSTRCAEPIILLTTAGADPSIELQALAVQKVGKTKFHQVAMGGGQQEEAMNLLRKCSTSGEWLCLKNLHLVIPWVSVLEQELNLLTPHQDFRLWLTSEAHDEFPSILLSTSLKVTFEAPPGVKQNLVRTYNFWDSQFLSTKTPAQAQLLFALAFLHATLQERRSYIPQGWTKFYEFSQADIRSAADIIIQQSGNGKIDWRTIHGVLENAIYGGRMESDFDVRVLKEYLTRLLSDKVLAGSGNKTVEPLTKGLALTATNSRKDYIDLIETHFAESDIPGLFALPPNADRTVQRSKVQAVTTSLVRLVEVASTAKMSREQWAEALNPLLQLWVQLCQPHADLLTMAVGRRDPRPVEGFVHAEVETALHLVAQVELTMSSLRKVIDGTMLLSETLRAEAAAMLAGEVPPAWDGRFNGPEAIIPWLKALIRKAVAIRKWYEQAAEGSLLKQVRDLSDLFRPRTFLDAVRQETARHTREPLVSLALVSTVGTPPPGAAFAIALKGLFLQGATIAQGVLDEIDSSDAPVVSQMPDVYVAWVPQRDVPSADSMLSLPVYTSLNKEAQMMELNFKCRTAADVTKFIFSGAAVVLEP